MGINKQHRHTNPERLPLELPLKKLNSEKKLP